MYGISEFRKTEKDDDTKEITRPDSGEKITFQDICQNIPYSCTDKDCVDATVDKCFNTG